MVQCNCTCVCVCYLIDQLKSCLLLWQQKHTDSESKEAYVDKVLSDEAGMLPLILTFVSQADKVNRLCQVSKTFYRVIHSPASWYEIDIRPVSLAKAYRMPEWLTSMTTIRAIASSTAPDNYQMTLDDMSPTVLDMKLVQHLRMPLNVESAMVACCTWPELQTIHIVSTSFTPHLDNLLRALTRMEDLTVLHLGVSIRIPDMDWPKFRTIKRCSCVITSVLRRAIVDHGDALTHLDVRTFEYGTRTQERDSFAEIMTTRGSQLVSLYVRSGNWALDHGVYNHGARAGDPVVVDLIVNHSGNLQVLVLKYFKITDDTSHLADVGRVVRANCSSLRALCIRFIQEDGHAISWSEMEALLEAIWEASGGRLEYLNLQWEYYGDTIANGYDAHTPLPCELIRRFRFAQVVVWAFVHDECRFDFVAEEYQMDEPLLSEHDDVIMDMYSDGLSPYPARIGECIG
jgi:hypothetical protein